MSETEKTFRLAPMSGDIRWMTIILLPLPFIVLAAGLFSNRYLVLPSFCVFAIYIWIWLRFRPTGFVVHPLTLEIVWPLKRRQLSRSDISEVRMIDRQELKQLIGWGMRVGAGGLWGGFGWLWTQRHGIVQMYVSRTDRFVWIERGGERPWLITPERPEDFVGALTAART